MPAVKGFGVYYKGSEGHVKLDRFLKIYQKIYVRYYTTKKENEMHPRSPEEKSNCEVILWHETIWSGVSR